MTNSTDWQDLIQKHLDGLTSEEEAAALSDQIVSNEAVRTDYLKAARLHGALGDETLELDDHEPIPFPQVEAKNNTRIHSLAWPRQLAAAIIAGIFIGLTGLGVVWAVNSPRIEVRVVPVAGSSFESMSGAVPIGFPTEFGRWSGDPAEVIVDADGNHQLRFLKTANVTGKPGGGAAACNVFQLIDLSSLQQQWDTENSEDQFTLELSANFRREAAPTDAELPKSRLTITIQLYQAEPDSIGKAWPNITREAVALSNKALRLAPGETSTLSASCLLDSEANLALISVNANSGSGAATPADLGGYYVDDVQLTAIKQPALPVRYVK
ncbi:MAG: hypothetical protein CMO47_04905 [Verrucomicrobiales bacterium]|nr:hypothetical protein [Verrucomicrobiales bacterium]|tara:strand:- start:454 stop:1428 length:975 start_codon:yes stop_codon:yes gene_type:complete